jgi:hypothetical protein
MACHGLMSKFMASVQTQLLFHPTWGSCASSPSSSYGKQTFPSFMRKESLFDCERAGLVDMSAAFFSAEARPNEWFTPSLALQQLKTCA